MRRALAIAVALMMIYGAAGCRRHVAGSCDCDHAGGTGLAAVKGNTPAMAITNAPAETAPATPAVTGK